MEKGREQARAKIENKMAVFQQIAQYSRLSIPRIEKATYAATKRQVETKKQFSGGAVK